MQYSSNVSLYPQLKGIVMEMETPPQRVAIICEYNPFHIGHERLFSIARELYPNCDIVSIMSGNTVQRGDFSVFDRYYRAEVASIYGSSLVLELPYPYSCAPAEQFAAAGVYIAAEMNSDILLFGSGAAEPDELFKIAELFSGDDFSKELGEMAKLYPERSFLSLRAELYEKRTGKELPTDGNSSLGIEYIIAAERINRERNNENKKTLRCVPIKREGSVSATQCRAIIRERPIIATKNDSAITLERGNFPKFDLKAESNTRQISALPADIPEEARNIFGRAPISGGTNSIGSIILASLRQMYFCEAQDTPHLLEHILETRGNSPKNAGELLTNPDVSRRAGYIKARSSGIRAALIKNSLKVKNIAELEATFPTATYTRARIRRELLDAVLLPDIPQQELRNALRRTPPPYTVLLAATERGFKILSETKKSSGLSVITKPSDTEKLSERGKAYYALSERAEALFALTFDPPLSINELIPRFKAKK